MIWYYLYMGLLGLVLALWLILALRDDGPGDPPAP